jgi:hypothetical protein
MTINMIVRLDQLIRLIDIERQLILPGSPLFQLIPSKNPHSEEKGPVLLYGIRPKKERSFSGQEVIFRGQEFWPMRNQSECRGIISIVKAGREKRIGIFGLEEK